MNYDRTKLVKNFSLNKKLSKRCFILSNYFKSYHMEFLLSLGPVAIIPNKR